MVKTLKIEERTSISSIRNQIFWQSFVFLILFYIGLFFLIKQGLIIFWQSPQEVCNYLNHSIWGFIFFIFLLLSIFWILIYIIKEWNKKTKEHKEKILKAWKKKDYKIVCQDSDFLKLAINMILNDNISFIINCKLKGSIVYIKDFNNKLIKIDLKDKALKDIEDFYLLDE